MRKTILTGLVAALLALPSAAFAEVLQGTITSLDKNSLNLSRTDAAGEMMDVKVKIDYSRVQLEGMDSVDDLEIGDYVSIDADKSGLTRDYKANSIAHKGSAPADRPDVPIKREAAVGETATTTVDTSLSQPPSSATDRVRQNTPLATADLNDQNALSGRTEPAIAEEINPPAGTQPGPDESERL